MKVSDISLNQLQTLLRQDGLQFKVGPFWLNLKSTIPGMSRHLERFYKSNQCSDASQFCDFHISLQPANGLRRFVRKQVIFRLDEYSPFKPLPINQAFAMFEWGLNWCIATHAHQFLIVHSAVVEKNGKAIIMPGMPGSGKSTLCAALIASGWRLLSDEMALINLDGLNVHSIPRPVALKNESISIISDHFDGVLMGPRVEDTAKGTVAHMSIASESNHDDSFAIPYVFLFPTYQQSAETKLDRLGKGRALILVYENAFNAHILGKNGFNAATELVSKVQSMTLTYSELGEALDICDRLVN